MSFEEINHVAPALSEEQSSESPNINTHPFALHFASHYSDESILQDFAQFGDCYIEPRSSDSFSTVRFSDGTSAENAFLSGIQHYMIEWPTFSSLIVKPLPNHFSLEEFQTIAGSLHGLIQFKLFESKGTCYAHVFFETTEDADNAARNLRQLLPNEPFIYSALGKSSNGIDEPDRPSPSHRIEDEFRSRDITRSIVFPSDAMSHHVWSSFHKPGQRRLSSRVRVIIPKAYQATGKDVKWTLHGPAVELENLIAELKDIESQAFTANVPVEDVKSLFQHVRQAKLPAQIFDTFKVSMQVNVPESSVIFIGGSRQAVESAKRALLSPSFRNVAASLAPMSPMSPLGGRVSPTHPSNGMISISPESDSPRPSFDFPVSENGGQLVETSVPFPSGSINLALATATNVEKEFPGLYITVKADESQFIFTASSLSVNVITRALLKPFSQTQEEFKFTQYGHGIFMYFRRYHELAALCMQHHVSITWITNHGRVSHQNDPLVKWRAGFRIQSGVVSGNASEVAAVIRYINENTAHLRMTRVEFRPIDCDEVDATFCRALVSVIRPLLSRYSDSWPDVQGGFHNRTTLVVEVWGSDIGQNEAFASAIRQAANSLRRAIFHFSPEAYVQHEGKWSDQAKVNEFQKQNKISMTFRPSDHSLILVGPPANVNRIVIYLGLSNGHKGDVMSPRHSPKSSMPGSRSFDSGLSHHYTDRHRSYNRDSSRRSTRGAFPFRGNDGYLSPTPGGSNVSSRHSPDPDYIDPRSASCTSLYEHLSKERINERPRSSFDFRSDVNSYFFK